MSAACAPRPSNSGCTKIENNWKSFTKVVLNAAKTKTDVAFCGFDIQRTEDDSHLVVKEKVNLACAEGETCTIEGPGTHIVVQGVRGQAALAGFTFKGATDSAIFVRQSSHNMNSFCDCTFISNKGAVRGSAVRAWTDCSVEIDSCVFEDNSAKFGGALYVNKGADVTVKTSKFHSNVAKFFGGAIRVYKNGIVSLRSSEFVDNVAETGAVIYMDDKSNLVDAGSNFGYSGQCDVFSSGLKKSSKSPKEECLRIDGLVIGQQPLPQPTSFPTPNPVESVPLASSNTNSPTNSPTVLTTDAPTNSPTALSTNTPTNLDTEAPTPSDTKVPTVSTTNAPVVISTNEPTAGSTNAPTNLPTAQPTTEPTRTPSKVSSVQGPTKEGEGPKKRRPTGPFIEPDGWFNYDPNDKKYGPDVWGEISPRETLEYAYWRRYSEMLRIDLNKNRCASDSHKQSPIELNLQTSDPDSCIEYHMIRTLTGEFPAYDENVKRQFLPNKLRILYPDRTPNLNPPSADIPKGWGHFMDTLHVDLRVPSEHMLNRKRYAAEYQVWFLQGVGDFRPDWVKRRGAAVVSILVDIGNRENKHFQRLLDAFRTEFDDHYAECHPESIQAQKKSLSSNKDKNKNNNNNNNNKNNSGGSKKSNVKSNADEENSNTNQIKTGSAETTDTDVSIARDSNIHAEESARAEDANEESAFSNYTDGAETPTIFVADSDRRWLDNADDNNVTDISDENGAAANSDKDDTLGLKDIDIDQSIQAPISPLDNPIRTNYSASISDPENIFRAGIQIPWDPLDRDWFMKSDYFYGYWGSLTEPPCTEFVHYRIIDVPMSITVSQFNELKDLLFNHVDPVSCHKTSNQYLESVARQVQPLNERIVHKCNCTHFLSDEKRVKQCRRNCQQPINFGKPDCYSSQ